MGSTDWTEFDLAAADCARVGHQLKRFKTHIRLDRLSGLSLPVRRSDGHLSVPCGDLAAAEFRAAARIAPLNQFERRSLELLADTTERLSGVYYPKTSGMKASLVNHPLAGAIGSCPLYPALVSRLHEPPGLQSLRQILIRLLMLPNRTPLEEAAVKQMRAVLVTTPTFHYEQTEAPVLRDAWRDGDPSEEDLIPALGPFLDNDLQLAEATCFAAVRTTTGSDWPTVPPDVVDTKQASQEPPIEHPPDPGVLQSEVYIPPRPDFDVPPTHIVPESDIGERQLFLTFDFDDTEPDEVTDEIPQTSLDFEYELATRHHWEGSIHPESARCLLREEVAEIWRLLEERLSNEFAIAAPDLLAIAIAALMLCTGRSRPELAAASAEYLWPEQHLSTTTERKIRLQSHYWTSIGPSLPSVTHSSSGWFDPVSSKVHFPLPVVAIKCLEDLRLHAASSIPVNRLQEDWDAAWESLRSELRSEVPRFTETRGFHTLPAQIYRFSGHIRDAQWVAGSDLGHSTAPQHYYTTDSERLQSLYAQACSFFGIALGSECPTEGLIGAPLAGIRFSAVAQAVEALNLKTKSGFRKVKGTTNKLVPSTTALGSYLALMFMACTAHRGTAPIATITRQDFILYPKHVVDDADESFGLAIVSDKSQHAVLDARICALPHQFVEQLHIYLFQLERLQRRLNEQPDAKYRTLREDVNKALAGTGPLWFWYPPENDEPNQSIERQDISASYLRDYWPEWLIDIRLLRHLFASHAHRYGLRGDDIALQMGHSMGRRAFDAIDPDSPVDFARRAAPSISAYLNDLGFEVVGEAQRFSPLNSFPQVSSSTIEALNDELNRLRKARDRQHAPIPTADEVLVADQAFDEILSLNQNKGTDWLIEPTVLRERLAFVSFAHSLAVQSSVRQKLRTWIDAQPRDSQKKRNSIPEIKRYRGDYCAVSSVHFAAMHWTKQAVSTAMLVLKDALKTKPVDIDKFLAAAVVLLPSYGGGATLHRLLAWLDPATRLLAFEQLEAGVIGVLPLENASPSGPGGESALTAGGHLALVAGARRLLSEPPDEKRLIRAIKNVPAINDLINNPGQSLVKSLLRTIALARALLAPGTLAAWETGEVASVGLAPNRCAALWNTRLSTFEPASTLLPSHFKKPKQPTESATHVPGSAVKSYREIRAIARALKEGGNRKDKRRALASIKAALSAKRGEACVPALLADFVMQALSTERLAASTVYSYLTTIGRRLVEQFEWRTLDNVDPSELSHCLRQIALKDRNEAKRETHGGAISAISIFMDVCSHLDIEIEPDVVFDGMNYAVPRSAGYCFAGQEWQAIDSALRERDRDVLMARTAVNLQMFTGMRISEVAGLLRDDITLAGNVLIANIHPTLTRTLKTRASKRITRVSVSPEVQASLESMSSTLQNRPRVHGNLLLTADAEIDFAAVRSTVNHQFQSSARTYVEAPYCRPHGLRHTTACRAQLVLHDSRYSAHLAHLLTDWGSRIGIQQDYRDEYGQLPRRLLMQQASRSLGHAMPETTMIHYAHMAPLLFPHNDGLERIPRKLEARLFGFSITAVEQRRKRKGGVSTTEQWSDFWRHDPKLMGVEVLRSNFDEFHLAQDESFANGYQMPVRISAALLARAAVLIRGGESETESANECLLSIDEFRTVANLLRDIEAVYQLNYLGARRERGRTRKRMPTAHRLLPLFRQIDESISDRQLDLHDLSDWQLRQLAAMNRQEISDGKFVEPIPDGLAEAITRFQRSMTKGKTFTKSELSLCMLVTSGLIRSTQ